jgi:hypothetical protein
VEQSEIKKVDCAKAHCDLRTRCGNLRAAESHSDMMMMDGGLVEEGC